MTLSAVCASTVFFSAYRYTGKERDTESGNDYFGARYYASSMGRFMSPDWSAKMQPVPYANLGNPQTLNLYAYVGNNPLSRVDPNGHDDHFYDQSGKEDLSKFKKHGWLYNAFVGNTYTMNLNNGGTVSFGSAPQQLANGQQYKILSVADTAAMMSSTVAKNAPLAQGMTLSQFRAASEDAQDSAGSKFDLKSQLDGNTIYSLRDGSYQSADSIGNMVWGYIAASAGIDLGTAHIGAGIQSFSHRDRNGFQTSWYRTLGDDPRDFGNINAGYAWYDATHPKPLLVETPGYH